MKTVLIIVICFILVVMIIQIIQLLYVRYKKRIVNKSPKLNIGDILISRENPNPFEEIDFITIIDIKKGSNNQWYVQYSFMQDETTVYGAHLSCTEDAILRCYQMYKSINYKPKQ